MAQCSREHGAMEDRRHRVTRTHTLGDLLHATTCAHRQCCSQPQVAALETSSRLALRNFWLLMRCLAVYFCLFFFPLLLLLLLLLLVLNLFSSSSLLSLQLFCFTLGCFFFRCFGFLHIFTLRFASSYYPDCLLCWCSCSLATAAPSADDNFRMLCSSSRSGCCHCSCCCCCCCCPH